MLRAAFARRVAHVSVVYAYRDVKRSYGPDNNYRCGRNPYRGIPCIRVHVAGGVRHGGS